ncbi:MAG: DnaJ domain-containing protein [Thermodesulfobacteriaceae bacterium]|nr:DnaJ domain-containing protein [Thermodesulfobacteriaceae bacterium]
MDWQKKWEAIERARKLLKLPIITTRKEIITKYHELAKEYHPDRGGEAEKMKAINEAYQLLIDFCDNYKIELRQSADTIDPSDFWFQHFGEDPLWAGKRDNEKERG